MFQRLIEYFETFQSRIQSSNETGECRDGNAFHTGSCCPKLILHMEQPFNKLAPETKDLLLKLDQFFPALRHVCRSLPVYHLAMIYAELKADASNWQLAITAELERRIIIFNWQVCYSTSLTFHTSYPISYSNQLFSTNINAALTFFNPYNTFIQYAIPQIGFKQESSCQDFMMNETSLCMGIPAMCYSMQKLVHIAAGKVEKCLYSTLYFPQIPDVEVKYVTSPEELAENVQPDEQVECILIFTLYHDPEESIKNLLNTLDKTQTIQIPFAGATAFGMSYNNQFMAEDETAKGMMNYIAFIRKKNSGPNFYAASIVVDQRQNFKTKLLEFKGSLERHEEEFLLCFVCFAKRRAAAEPEILAKNFDCPVFYMQVNGEFGYSCYTKEHREGAKDPKRKRNDMDYLHGYTTVMVYVSWGKLKKATKPVVKDCKV